VLCCCLYHGKNNNTERGSRGGRLNERGRAKDTKRESDSERDEVGERKRERGSDQKTETKRDGGRESTRLAASDWNTKPGCFGGGDGRSSQLPISTEDGPPEGALEPLAERALEPLLRGGEKWRRGEA